MYKHILLATDGSKNADRAANEAVKIASSSKDTIVEVVYVVDFEKVKSEVLHASSKEALINNRLGKLQKAEQILREADINYKVTTLHGSPGEEIVKYANAQAVDLVIIGSRGLNTLQEMMLGSVSHKVMKRVKCPALIVK